MNTLTIGQVAKRSGVAPSALRFYEEMGLITSDRTASGHRRFSRTVLRQVAFIVFAQHIGMSLGEVRTLLEQLPDGRIPKSRDWSKLSSAWIGRIDERIAEMKRLRASLASCIGCGCLSLESCELANPRDRLSRRGAGPRIWLDAPR